MVALCGLACGRSFSTSMPVGLTVGPNHCSQSPHVRVFGRWLFRREFHSETGVVSVPWGYTDSSPHRPGDENPRRRLARNTIIGRWEPSKISNEPR